MTKRSNFFLALLCGAAFFFPSADPFCRSDEPVLTKTGKLTLEGNSDLIETSPVYWHGRAVLLGAIWKGKDAIKTYAPDSLRIVDWETGETLASFGQGCSFCCAFVETDDKGEEIFHVFAAQLQDDQFRPRDILHFSSRDLKDWDSSVAIAADAEHLFNSSVCRDGDGYIMAYESDVPVQFNVKFARSRDLVHWEKVPDVFYAGPDGKTYCACPVVRKCEDRYYVVHLHRDDDGRYVSVMIRSKDLVDWEPSPKNPILAPSEDEGINNSDVDMIEQDGKTRFVYLTGDQQTWNENRDAYFDGSLAEFFAACYPEDAEKGSAKTKD